MPSSTLRLQDLRALYQLIGECRDLGDDPLAWRRHLLAGLIRLCEAGVAVGGQMLGLRAGRPSVGQPVEWGWEQGFDQAGWLRTLAEFGSDPSFSVTIMEYLRRGAHETGEALSRTDLLPDRAWYRSNLFEHGHRKGGVNESLICLRPVPRTADDFDGIVLLRAAGERDFSGRHRLLVREAYAIVAPLIGGALAHVGEPSPSELPPRVRDVLRCLLEGDSDKQAAARLGISKYTVNQYAKVIFLHFRVTTRPELLARWVRRGWSRGSTW